jgi:DNA-binding MarR family transcriptional regulator
MSDIIQDESQLPVLRALYTCVRQVERVSNRHIESMGLTMAQFDVLAVLGDTDGMTCKELGEKSLITRGTLLPVLGRLEDRGLVHREKNEKDQRQTIVKLTADGQKLYEETFTPHIEVVKPRFEVLSDAEQKMLISLLNKVETSFNTPLPAK